MRILFFVLLASAAYGQRFMPPDIVPADFFARRDPLKVDAKHYSLEFENEHVRTLRLTLKADEAVPMHDDVDAVAVCIRECHLRFAEPGGHTQDVHMQTGESRWLYGDTHSSRNLNTQPMEMLVIEMKDATRERRATE